MTPTVSIAVRDFPAAAPDGEAMPMRVEVTLPADAAGPVVLPAGGVYHPSATLNLDLLRQDVTLAPGETVCVALSATFATAGPADLADFRLQVNPADPAGGNPQQQRFPAHAFRVVPSLSKALAVTLERLCTYDEGHRVDVCVKNRSAADLEDLILRFGPASGVRAGPLVRRLARLRPGERVTVELVVAGGALEVAAAATLAGERVEETRSLPVPAGDPGGSDAPPLYAFLEPRALTTDRVTLAPEGGGAPVEAAGGVFAVRGGGRYLLTIHPTRPAATGVRVYAAAGRVEVEPQAAAAGAWPFLVTVVDNPLLTQAVRLDYDVEAAGQPPLRGEFYLSVRPATVRRWLFALTAGAAVTVKGVTAIVPALWRDDPGRDFVLEDLPELLAARATDAWQAVSIPLIWAALWVVDLVWRQSQDA